MDQKQKSGEQKMKDQKKEGMSMSGQGCEDKAPCKPGKKCGDSSGSKKGAGK